MARRHRDRGGKRAGELNYLMDEVLFLRGQGESPVMIAHLLHRERGTLIKLARRNNRVDVADALMLDDYEEKAWRGNAWLDTTPGATSERRHGRAA